MTRDRLDQLLRHCADMGLEVEWCDLGEYRRGDYCDELRVIRLNSRLTVAQATATTAHEIGHATFGDRCSTAAIERRAWEYGASLAVSRHEYAAAEALVGPHVGALAAELEVTPKLIEAWRRWYLRRWPVERRLATEMAVKWADSRSGDAD